VSILVTSKTKTIPGPDVRFNCPRCRLDSSARSYERKETMGVFFIPLITQRERYVECCSCGTTRLTRLPLEELDRYTADELGPHLQQRVSFIVKFLVVVSLLLFFVPIVGLVMGLIALIATYRTGGWLKRLSLIGLVLSALVTSLFAVLMVLAAFHAI
jgi:hypothetical protein